MATLLDTIFSFLGRWRYNASPPTIADGQIGEAQCDANGNLKVFLSGGELSTSGATIVHYSPGTTLQHSYAVKTSAGVLRWVWGFNNSAAKRYIQIYNSTSIPGDGVVAIKHLIPVEAGGFFSFEPPVKIPFSAGISWATSSTAVTKTIGAAEAWVEFLYSDT